VPEQASSTKIEFSFDKFQNPYSSVLVETSVRWYSDIDCLVNQSQQGGTDLTFRAAEMAPEAATVSSTSQVVGYQSSDNALNVGFLPAAALPPNG
jgi:hypothetical protein